MSITTSMYIVEYVYDNMFNVLQPCPQHLLLLNQVQFVWHRICCCMHSIMRCVQTNEIRLSLHHISNSTCNQFNVKCPEWEKLDECKVLCQWAINLLIPFHNRQFTEWTHGSNRNRYIVILFWYHSNNCSCYHLEKANAFVEVRKKVNLTILLSGSWQTIWIWKWKRVQWDKNRWMAWFTVPFIIPICSLGNRWITLSHQVPINLFLQDQKMWGYKCKF